MNADLLPAGRFEVFEPDSLMQALFERASVSASIGSPSGIVMYRSASLFTTASLRRCWGKSEVVVAEKRARIKADLLLALAFSMVLLVSVLGGTVRLGFCSGRVVVVPDDFQKISWAVGNASEGSTVLVKSGVYFESQVIVDKTLSLIGENAENTVIDGGGTLQTIFLVIANNVVIENFTFQNTNFATYSPAPAVSLSNVTNVTLSSCFFKNVGVGVEVRSSNFTGISHDKISNSTIGLVIRDVSYNNVVSGNILENDSLAVWVKSPTCSYNRVFHNSFLNDTNTVSDFGSSDSYDDGYPSGGNFWSGYAGNDLFHGQFQNESGSDGISDQSYPSSENPLDRYPFVFPLTEIEVAAGGNSFFLQVSTDANLIGCFFNETGKNVSLMVQPGGSGNGSGRVTIPVGLLSTNDTSEWKVLESLVNGTTLERPCLAVVDSGNTYVYFSYSRADVSRIEIRGTTVLNEVPIFLMIAVVALASVVLLFGKRSAKRAPKQAFARVF